MPSRNCSATRWPGNVRELRNVVERLLLLADGPVDRAAVRLALPQAADGSGRRRSRSPSGPLAERVDAFERDQILAELKRHNQRMTDTAKALGLERSHLYKKCQALGIDLRALRKGGRRLNAHAAALSGTAPAVAELAPWVCRLRIGSGYVPGFPTAFTGSSPPASGR